MTLLASEAVATVGSALSGKVGAVVFSHNRHGPYSYVQPSRIDPNTSAQQAIRGSFRNAAMFWPFELASRRALWDSYAENVLKTNRLGKPCRLSGFNYYMGVATMRAVVGQFPPYYAPEIFTVGLHSSPAYTAFLGTFLIVNYQPSDRWPYDNAGAAWLYQSRPQPSTVNYFDGPWVNFAFVSGNPASPPLTRFLAFSFPPSPPLPRIFIRSRILEADNRFSPDNVQHLDFY